MAFGGAGIARVSVGSSARRPVGSSARRYPDLGNSNWRFRYSGVHIFVRR